jgi:hypothetical protein
VRGLLLSVVAGCSFSTSAPPVIDDPLIDASIVDVMTTTIDACTTFSTQVNTCIVPPNANMALALTGTNTYNTENHTLTNNGTIIPVATATVLTSTGTIDVIYVSSFSLAAGATLRAIGPLPFAIVASGTVEIEGTISLVGPAAGSRTDAICLASTGAKGQNSNLGAGGGGGGAFQGDGGDGSNGNGDGTQTQGGDGGTKIAARPTGIMGGCDGGDGGEAQGDGAAAGDGGGAILIAAGVSITISGTGVINVGGGGGQEGNANGRGGSGGGSGGMILLESAQVAVAGVLAANGGGGGEGNADGRDGEDGQPSATPADGGTGGDPTGGNGADGAAGADLDGDTTNDVQNGGGGGGGGGAGFIAINCPAPAISGVVSPMFAAWP